MGIRGASRRPLVVTVDVLGEEVEFGVGTGGDREGGDQRTKTGYEL